MLAGLLIAQLQTNGFNLATKDPEFILLPGTASDKLERPYLCVNAYAAADVAAGKTNTAWEGSIQKSFINDVEDDRYLRTLLHYFGRDFKGAAPLVE